MRRVGPILEDKPGAPLASGERGDSLGGMLTPPTLTPAERASGFLAGAAIGSALAARTASLTDPDAIDRAARMRPLPLAPPPDRRRAATALADSLLEELLSGGVDLHRLSGRWVEWWRADGLDSDDQLGAALGHLAEFDAPADALPMPGHAVLAAMLPAALTRAVPGTMVSGVFHTARLLDPDPEAGLAATAVVVAAASLLGGSRDFMPEVLGLLRANEASDELFDRFVAIPRDPGQPPQAPRGSEVGAVTVAVWALWQVQNAPRSAAALERMVLAGGISATAGAVLGALLGARDGIGGWPPEWLDGAGEEALARAAVAERIAVPAEG